MTHVLDASALLALAIGEPGAARVLDAIPDAIITSVNLAEVITRLIERGGSRESVKRTLALFNVAVVDFDEELAWLSATLRSATRAAGLSLGDRACLALAMREGAIALTADRAWTRLDLDCDVELIR